MSTQPVIGEAFAFPKPTITLQNGSVEWGPDGMTYRQWLIGQIASGLVADPNFSSREEFAVCVIMNADAIIAKLEAERQPA